MAAQGCKRSDRAVAQDRPAAAGHARAKHMGADYSSRQRSAQAPTRVGRAASSSPPAAGSRAGIAQPRAESHGCDAIIRQRLCKRCGIGDDIARVAG